MRVKEDRTSRILEILVVKQKAEVTDLSNQLGVSQVTIRKDLDNMESLGIIHREHGYAILASTDDLNGRIAYHYDQKRKIALKATELVKDGETIMIESGSCCTLLADALTEQKKNLTIITNSAFIANYIRKKSNFQIILLGGIFQQDAQVNVGPMIRQCVENFYVSKFFIGVDGYAERTGFTNQDQMRAQAVRDMATQAESIIVLTESDKFLKRGTVPMNLKNQVKTVVTDSQLSKEITDQLLSQNIQVINVF